MSVTVSSTAADRAIAAYHVLERTDLRELQAIVELAALSCGLQNAAINFITSTEQYSLVTAGIDPKVCGHEESMCVLVLDRPEVVIVPDATEDPLFADHPFVDGTEANVRFYASAQLATPDGVAIGRICVFDDEPHRLEPSQYRLLEILADRVMDLLELELGRQQLESSFAELTRSQDELKRSNERLSRFAGQVTHDLRSPLTAILANTDLLAESPLIEEDDELRPLVDATVRAAERMNALISRILAYTKLGAELTIVDLDLGELFAEVEADLEPRIRARNATVHADPLPAIRGDREQLYSILLNLMTNALKFVPTDRAPIVTVTAQPDPDGWRISVSDNGDGIPLDRRAVVFGLYARDSDTAEGSGIGLATVRGAVEAHGGRIGVTDALEEYGGGACFWFTIPA